MNWNVSLQVFMTNFEWKSECQIKIIWYSKKNCLNALNYFSHLRFCFIIPQKYINYIFIASQYLQEAMKY